MMESNAAGAGRSTQLIPEVLPGADMRGAQLIGVDLSGRNLMGCCFDGADLGRANLAGAKLAGASFIGASMCGIDLSGAQMVGCDFTDADLSTCEATEAQFGSADLTNAVLFDADLSRASLTSVRATGCDFRAVCLDGARLREADLRRSDFSRASLVDADLFSAQVDDSHFASANLSRARLRQVTGYDSADWIGVDILNVDFAGSYMTRRTIVDQNYLHEFRTRSKRHARLYQLWWLTSDCGRSFVRWGAVTALFALLFGGLYQLVDVDYGDAETALSPYYFSVVTLTTLGYGDVLPNSLAAQILVIIQVIIGYVMLGGVLSIFANKMSRRAD